MQATVNRFPYLSIVRFCLITCCLLVCFTGCPSSEPDEAHSRQNTSISGVSLSLLVVGDTKIAEAANKLEGEWNVQTGASFEVKSLTEEEFAQAGSIDADSIICPAYMLGRLAEKSLITKVPESILREEKRSWADTFELLRLREANWNSEVRAVPFGSPVLVCYYRPDLFEKLGLKPPKTWKEYHKAAKMLAQHKPASDTTSEGKKAPWFAVAEPLAPGWAGFTLLARAAPYAKHRDYFSALFDIDSMEPLIEGPPWVRALEELVAAAKLGPSDALEYNPAAVRTAFWQGHCGLALTWPSAVPPLTRSIEKSTSCALTELPGATDVYNLGEKAWTTRGKDEPSRVPLLGISGRVGAVSSGTLHPKVAFHLLFWLADEQVSVSSRGATLYRSQGISPKKWVEAPLPSQTASEYASLLHKTFRREQCLFVPRIPGRADYMAALDRAVEQAVRGEKSPADALHEAARRWQEITKQLGVDSQRRAYWHSFGLEL